jgi:hypothetical protein
LVAIAALFKNYEPLINGTDTRDHAIA